MANRSIGEMISYLRKEKGMTQNDLAEIMNVTDKAVSKWERNLSCPDINSIPKLAEVLGVSADELLNAEKSKTSSNSKMNEIINIALLGIGVAMGICVIVTSVLNEINTNSAFALLGIGLSSLGIYLLKNKNSKQ